MRKSKRSWALLFIFAFALAGHHCAAEDWVITKEGGAYRVNGLRLMANGTLVDGNGARVKTLTRADMDQIGAAIDAFEAGHVSPYAKPAIVGVTGTTAPVSSGTPDEKHSDESARPRDLPAQADPFTTQSSPPETSTSSSSPAWVTPFLCGLFLLVGWRVYVSMFPYKCPRCGERVSVQHDGTMTLGSFERLEYDETVKTDVHRDKWGNKIGTTDRTETTPVVRTRTVVEHELTCKKCRKKWSSREVQ